MVLLEDSGHTCYSVELDIGELHPSTGLQLLGTTNVIYLETQF